MAVLMQTLRWAGSLTVLDEDVVGAGSGTVETITAAGAKDGNDATQHVVNALDSIVGEHGNTKTSVYGSLDPYSAGGLILFVRAKVRARGFLELGAGPFSAAVHLFSAGGAAQIADLIAIPTYSDLQADFVTNPGTGLDWDASALAGSQLGLRLTASNQDLTFLTASSARFSEFELEVWGDPESVASVKSRYGSDIMLARASGILEQPASYGSAPGASRASDSVTETATYGTATDLSRGSGIAPQVVASGGSLPSGLASGEASELASYGASPNVARAEGIVIPMASHSDAIDKVRTSGIVEE